MFDKLDIGEVSGDNILDYPVDEKLAESVFNFGIPLPYVIKNAILISPGTWNKFYYNKDSIKKAHRMTDWEDKSIKNLYLDHADDKTSQWVGNVSNLKCINGTEYGDLNIFDPITAVKMAKGKPKFGISPRVRGRAEEGIMKEFTFENFSFVINPAVKTTYINNMEVKTMEFKLQEEGEAKVETPKPEEETKEEAKEELAKKKEEPKEEEMKKKKEPEEEEMKKKKDYGYPKEELSEWSDKIKKWCKAHPGKGVKEAIAAIKKEMEEVEMASEDKRFKEILQEVLEIMKKKTKEEEPDEYPYKKKLSEMQEELASRDKAIEELKEQTMKLEQRLNKPAERITVKSEEPTTQMLSYSDENFLEFLREDGQGKAEMV